MDATTRGGIAALIVAALLALALPAAASAADRSAACPAAVPPPQDAGTVHAPSIACLHWWGLSEQAPAELRLARAAVAKTLADLLVRSGQSLSTPARDAFDDDDGHPDEVVLSELSDAGVLRGTSAASVRPDSWLTRGQLASVAVRITELVLGRPLPAAATSFTDIAATTHYEAIAKAATAGLLSGRDLETFAPGRVATFGQLATVLVRVLDTVVAAGIVDPPVSAGAFDLAVVPSRVDAIAGQRVVWLLSLARDDRPQDGAVILTASAPDAQVTPASATLTPGQVVEVTVVPEALAAVSDESQPREAVLALRLSAARGSDHHRVVAAQRVLVGEDTVRDEAVQRLQRWTTWLATAHTELGITPTTDWAPTPNKPVWLGVSHYLFFSPEWELGLSWHVMVAPHDWSRIYLRRRTELAPSFAFELGSVSDPAGVPVAIEPPAVVDR